MASLASPPAIASIPCVIASEFSSLKSHLVQFRSTAPFLRPYKQNGIRLRKGSMFASCSPAALSKNRALVVRASSSSTETSPESALQSRGFPIKLIPTQPIPGQKTGTSGLRKKLKVFREPNYLKNWVQALFNSLPPEDYKNGLLVLGGDGRYGNDEAAQIIIKIAAANGVGKMLVGRDAVMSTPAVSAVIRKYKANGGFIMTASHNPAGPNGDWGIKFNYNSGQPAPESITKKIYENTLSISQIKYADIPDVDLDKLGTTDFGNFSVEVIDSFDDYLELVKDIYDFELIRRLMTRPDFKFKFDAMHAVTCGYAHEIFVEELEAPPESIMNGKHLDDFGNGHPDPNLTYAKDLVDAMFSSNPPDFGAASDGDGDRNMILGSNFFVTPSDSVALIAANATTAIPYFKDGLKGLARSMPTSGALDLVAKKLDLPFFEVPTGWKYFGNLMDAGKLSICGEESFGTGSDHVREKDGIWAVLAWLSILAYRNRNSRTGEKLVTVADIVKEHWKTYGRNFFSRYDYEECDLEAANKMVEHLRSLVSDMKPGQKYGDYTVKLADDFTYTDPVDGSVASEQGIRFIFTDGSRIIFRLSGTGSAGATIRVYVERYEPDVAKHNIDAQTALKPLIDVALSISKLQEYTGREKPTVIT
eukprot:TRINITY_DN4342_c0_g1_i2.p1 TRINITY_DN4342_c0_g1~~TRINITY_DN4342_c0_g1_i2.p1  ORF type:complete len:647 (-),score=141.84 TRINITY_DN4342_c0_g1_i2:411-2351(-)